MRVAKPEKENNKNRVVGQFKILLDYGACHSDDRRNPRLFERPDYRRL